MKKVIGITIALAVLAVLAGYVATDGARATAVTLEVDIDIKPENDDPKPINLRSRGVIPVAVLSSDFFDATTLVPETIEFAGAPVDMYHFEDIDSDGILDKVAQFRTQEVTDLTKGDTEACLKAYTSDGIGVQGCDSIRVVDDQVR